MTTKRTKLTKIPQLDELRPEIDRIYAGEGYADKGLKALEEEGKRYALHESFATGFAEGVLFVMNIMENRMEKP